MYVRTVGPPNAKIFLVGEAPGEEEDKYGKPFIGPAGQKLDQLLAEAGISRHECLIGNVARERPPGNKIEFFYEDKKRTVPKPFMQKWINELKEEIQMFKPNIVVALGDTALRHLCDIRGISAFRGYVMESTLVPKQKVLATYHPQKTNYEWRFGFTVVMDLRKAIINSHLPDLPRDARQLHAGVSFSEFMDYLDWLLKGHTDPIAVDIETTDPGCHIDVLGIAANQNLAMSYQVIRGRQPVLNPMKEAQLWKKLSEVLTEKEVVMHNGVFDLAVLWLHTHVFTKHLKFDTLIAGHVAWPECPRSLAYMSSLCLNVPAWKHTAEEAPMQYNAADAANTYGVFRYMEKVLTNLNLWNTFNFEMQQIIPATMLQLQGIRVDPEVQSNLRKECIQRMSALDKELEQEVGKKVNFNSSKQMKELLYIDMGLPTQFKRRKSKTETRTVTTDANALMNLSRKSSNPILNKILEYKKLHKLITNFLDIEISPECRVHTSYNITGATMLRKKKGLIIDDEEAYKSFGRWSSSESIILPYGPGNLQNIPKAARTIYKAPQGYKYLQADYMQAEAEVVAFCINDEPTKLLFRNSFGLSREERKERGLDIHKLTAAMMFGKQVQEVTKEERDIGKRLRHATNYSAGPTVLANNVGCSVKEAKELFAAFHRSCPQLRMWHARLQNELRKTRTLTNLLGRKHKFLERWGDELFRSSYSFIPQSTVGDLLNLALIRVYIAFADKIEIVLQLHDAIYFIVPENDVEYWMKEVRHKMLIPLHSPYGEDFTIDVDFAVGDSWGELEEI